MSVGVLEDYKLRDLRASHTLSHVTSVLTIFFLWPHLHILPTSRRWIPDAHFQRS
jgi:hypothetical protein